MKNKYLLLLMAAETIHTGYTMDVPPPESTIISGLFPVPLQVRDTPQKGTEIQDDRLAPYFVKKYKFSTPLLDLNSIQALFLSKKIDSTLYLSAFQKDALENKIAYSVHKLFQFYTKGLGPNKEFKLEDLSDPRILELLHIGVELHLPWALFERGERLKKSPDEITTYHFWAASRGHTVAAKYTERAYSIKDFPFLDPELTDFGSQKLIEIRKCLIIFYDEWKEKKYSRPLIDLRKQIDNLDARIKAMNSRKGQKKTKNLNLLFNLELDAEIAILTGDSESLIMCGNGFRKSKQYTQAITCYAAASIFGNFMGAYFAGYVIASEYPDQNPEVSGALAYLKKAAELGDTVSMNRVGLMIKKGHADQAPNIREAMVYFEEAAEHGSQDALYSLAEIHSKGFPGQPADPSKAIYYYQRVIDLGKLYQFYPYALYSMGAILRNNDLEDKDNIRALKCFEENIAFGPENNPNYVACLCHVGAILLTVQEQENSIIEKDPRKARKYIMNAASRGHPQSLLVAGYIYENGLVGVKQDKQEALIKYKEASKKGFALASHGAGALLRKGFGKTPADLKQAVAYFKKAARKNIVEAMLELCSLYLFDLNNIEMALNWLERAEQLDPEKTKPWRELAAKKLTEAHADDSQVTVEKDSINVEVEELVEPKGSSIMTLFQPAVPREAAQPEAHDEVEDEDSDTPDEFLNLDAKAINKNYQLQKLAERLRENAELDKVHVQLSEDSKVLLQRIQRKDNALVFNDFVTLFSDPFFKKQIGYKPTKSGITIWAVNRVAHRHGSCGTHRKHGQTYDGFDWNFLGKLWAMLDSVYDVGALMNQGSDSNQ